MTDEEAIAAAIEVAISTPGAEGEGAAIRAAAPGLIAHGREQAAKAIEAYSQEKWEEALDCGGRPDLSEVYEMHGMVAAGDVGRGGTP